jgi:flavodoxin I
MARIGLFYGSETGSTRQVAQVIKSHFDDATMSAPLDAGMASAEDVLSYDYLIVGAPTVGVGGLPAEWENLMERLRHVDLSGKTVAVFGLGDHVGYVGQFADAIGDLADFFAARGAQVVGSWPGSAYEGKVSHAVRGGRFTGLALDEENEADFTRNRVKTWLNMISPDFQLGPVH